MSRAFEELAWHATPLGELCLRRRQEPALGDAEVYEVKLGDEFLMSSLFTVGETALADLALARIADRSADVVVGGLGLGYTARAALAHANVRELLVVEALGEVIEWHRRGLVPLGAALDADPRCRLVLGDFFALAARPADGFDPVSPARRFDAVLLDVDHAPGHWLHPRHAAFYGPEGLASLRAHLKPGGVFAMWSNERPDAAFLGRLEAAFEDTAAELVEFPNPYTGETAHCTVYLGAAPADDGA